MSSLYIRTLIRNWAARCATPYYDTINQEQNPKDAVWFTIDFEPEQSGTSTYCGDTFEEGVIDLVFCGAPGVGDVALLTAAEADAKVFLAQVDPAGKFTIKRAMPPEEFSAGDADPWYRAVLGLEYEYHP
jgi:hypothetical protein